MKNVSLSHLQITFSKPLYFQMFCKITITIREALAAANASRFVSVSVYPPSLNLNENPIRSETSVRE